MKKKRKKKNARKDERLSQMKRPMKEGRRKP